MWNPANISIDIIFRHQQAMHIRIKDRLLNVWFLLLVYNSPHKGSKKDIWQCLTAIGKPINGPWCIVGDFNAFLFLS